MAISKIILNGVTQIDVTGKTVTSASMRSGVTALKNDGTDITGSLADMTLPSAASASSSGTSKATITPTSSAQYLNIPPGYNDTAQYYTIAAASGGSSWTLIKSNQELTASTTSTQASEAGTIDCGSSIYTSAKIVWVHIRDKAGPRAGYFYGSDTFFINHNPKNNATSTFTTPAVATIRYTTSNAFNVYTGSYGVFGYSISSDGVLTLRKRYSGSYSLTVNGTYVIDVYTLDLPTGETIFD